MSVEQLKHEVLRDSRFHSLLNFYFLVFILLLLLLLFLLICFLVVINLSCVKGMHTIKWLL